MCVCVCACVRACVWFIAKTITQQHMLVPPMVNSLNCVKHPVVNCPTPVPPRMPNSCPNQKRQGMLPMKMQAKMMYTCPLSLIRSKLSTFNPISPSRSKLGHKTAHTYQTIHFSCLLPSLWMWILWVPLLGWWQYRQQWKWRGRTQTCCWLTTQLLS